MQESQSTRFVFNHNRGKSTNKKRSHKLNKRSPLFSVGLTVLVVVLAILAAPIFMWILKSAGLPLWLALLPLLVVILALAIVVALQLQHPAVAKQRRERRKKGKSIPQDKTMRRKALPPVEAGLDGFLQMLDSLLDASWVVYRDVQLPNSAEKIAAVLVGNAGVYVMEVNTDAGNYRLTDGLWEWQDWHDRWRVDQKNPIIRIYQKRDKLAYILSSEQGDVPVYARLIWAGEGQIDIPPTERTIWFIHDGGDSIWHDLHRGRVMPAKQIEEICWLLEQFSSSPDPAQQML